MQKEKKETRQVSDILDMSLLKWRIEADGLELLVQGFKEKKILGRKCHKCGMVYVPGPSYCRKCFIDIQDVVEVSKKGKIACYTVNLADVRGNPVDEISVAVQVKLDGSDSWMMGQLEIDDWKKVHVGMPAELILREETTGALADMVCFRPI
ncbi:MAG: hypothetical protein NT009_06090 [Proteobacteria bacterium]|nr:hypothetical protein [Pseudomonadota bacterium]